MNKKQRIQGHFNKYLFLTIGKTRIAKFLRFKMISLNTDFRFKCRNNSPISVLKKKMSHFYENRKLTDMGKDWNNKKVPTKINFFYPLFFDTSNNKSELDFGKFVPFNILIAKFYLLKGGSGTLTLSLASRKLNTYFYLTNIKVFFNLNLSTKFSKISRFSINIIRWFLFYFPTAFSSKIFLPSLLWSNC